MSVQMINSTFYNPIKGDLDYVLPFSQYMLCFNNNNLFGVGNLTIVCHDCSWRRLRSTFLANRRDRSLLCSRDNVKTTAITRGTVTEGKVRTIPRAQWGRRGPKRDFYRGVVGTRRFTAGHDLCPEKKVIKRALTVTACSSATFCRCAPAWS